MNTKSLNRLLEIYAQATSTPPAAPVQPATSTTTTKTAPTVDIRSIPGFKPTLFRIKPDLISDLNSIVEIINTNLFSLSGGAANFTMVWTNPSISGSQYSNSVKNLLTLGKWIYEVIKNNSNPYTTDGLRQIANGLMATVKSYSFPEPEAKSIQSDLVSAAQAILAKLGGLQ